MSDRQNAAGLEELERVAALHNLKTKRDSCGEPLIVPGNPRRSEDISHVYQHDDKTFGLVLLYDVPTRWNNAKRKLTGLGFTVHQDGDTEGVLLFDAHNEAQLQVAIKTAGLKVRRQYSGAALEAIRANIAKVNAERAQRAADASGAD